MAATIPEGARVFVLTGWPEIEGFEETWNDDTPIADDTPTTHSRAYFEQLVSLLNGSMRQEVTLIPSAEVLYRLAPRLEAGEVPGISNLDALFSDEVHLGSPGNWVSGVTAATVMTGLSADTFGKPGDPWYGSGDEYSAEFIQLVRGIVDDVVGRPATG
ncbi:hypothetical protein ACFLQ7_02685 [Actinomycetota bacterium]